MKTVTFTILGSIFLLLSSGCQLGDFKQGMDNVAESSKGGMARVMAGTQSVVDSLNKPRAAETKIDSNPQGAFIEVNGEYIGKAPLKINWLNMVKRYPEMEKAESLIFKAYAFAPNQYTQSVIFHKAQEEDAGKSYPPSRISFEMGLKPMDKSEEE